MITVSSTMREKYREKKKKKQYPSKEIQIQAMTSFYKLSKANVLNTGITKNRWGTLLVAPVQKTLPEKVPKL